MTNRIGGPGVVAVWLLAVAAGSASAQAPPEVTDAAWQPAWSWEASVGPVVLIPTTSPGAVTGLRVHGARYWGTGPVRTGVELSATLVPGEGGGLVTLGAVEQRPLVGPVEFFAHLGAGALWYPESYVSLGLAPCDPDADFCAPGPEAGTVFLPLGYAGLGLGLGLTDWLRLRGGSRLTVVRGEDGLVTLLELPIALVVRF